MRYENWPILLNDYVLSCAKKPFVWGEHDCCMFAAGAVSQMTGVDYAAAFRGLYSTREEAEQILAERGGLENIVSELLGPPIELPFAQRGDVVIREEDEGFALGIVLGTVAAFTGGAGLVFLPTLTSGLKAWRVE